MNQSQRSNNSTRRSIKSTKTGHSDSEDDEIERRNDNMMMNIPEDDEISSKDDIDS